MPLVKRHVCRGLAAAEFIEEKPFRSFAGKTQIAVVGMSSEICVSFPDDAGVDGAGSEGAAGLAAQQGI